MIRCARRSAGVTRLLPVGALAAILTRRNQGRRLRIATRRIPAILPRCAFGRHSQQQARALSSGRRVVAR
jgi:hypothetical protein